MNDTVVFIGIGTRRSGSSWLHSFLNKQTTIVKNEGGEHFFLKIGPLISTYFIKILQILHLKQRLLISLYHIHTLIMPTLLRSV